MGPSCQSQTSGLSFSRDGVYGGRSPSIRFVTSMPTPGLSIGDGRCMHTLMVIEPSPLTQTMEPAPIDLHALFPDVEHHGIH